MSTPIPPRGRWTFSHKIAAGFAALVGLSLLIAVISVASLQAVVSAKDEVIERGVASLVRAANVNAAVDAQVASLRGYLITPSDEFLTNAEAARARGLEQLRALEAHPGAAEAMGRIFEAERIYHEAMGRLVRARDGATDLAAVTRTFERETVPLRRALDREVDAFVTWAQARLVEDRDAASSRATTAVVTVVALGGAAVLVAIVVGWLLVRVLTRQVGDHVQHVQSSAAELHTAANQQATAAKETSSAISEIATTINELLVTSRQITESAQRVAQIAQDGARAAKQGDSTMREAEGSMGVIRRQIDAVVAHMLELGQKSQQIGGILEIINELADQTNILAINATIEAAGAGEHGLRFAVVGDEIRKLADRVGGSAREVRKLVDEIRAAVNTTVMVTEGGSKSVDAGLRQFGEVATVFAQIGSVVTTTSSAGREIELSTKQQQTAVEQVNVALTGVVQATHENETSLGQILATATQLSALSRDLSRLVQARA